MAISPKLISALVGIGLSFAVVAVADAEGSRLVQTVTAGSYEMPRGDFTHLAPSRPAIEIVTRIPIGGRELQRLKALPGEPAGNDPAEAPRAGRAQPTAVTQKCKANIATGWTPSDIHGAAGPTNLVVLTNSDIGVYSKADCSIVSRVSLKTLFGAAFLIPDNELLFDPRAIFDARAGRFLVTTDSQFVLNYNQFQYFAVSKDAEGTSWWLYRIVMSKGSSYFCKSGNSSFWDYPSAGKNDRRWFITANDFPLAGGATGAILDIDKGPTLDGAPTTVICFNNVAFNVQPPIVLDGNTKAFFLSPGSIHSRSVRRYTINTDGAVIDDGLNQKLPDIPIAHWTVPPDAPQPNGQRLATFDGRFQSATTQVANRLYNVHTINIEGFARWRLYAFSTSGSTLFRFTPAVTAGAHNFNASVATSSSAPDAKIFVTYSRTIPTGGDAGRAAMLIGAGPQSSKASWNFSLIGTSAGQFSHDNVGNSCNANGSCRWGDYSSTQVDPVNPDRAWGFNQLITTQTIFKAGSEYNWITRAAEVE